MITEIKPDAHFEAARGFGQDTRSRAMDIVADRAEAAYLAIVAHLLDFYTRAHLGDTEVDETIEVAADALQVAHGFSDQPPLRGLNSLNDIMDDLGISPDYY